MTNQQDPGERPYTEQELQLKAWAKPWQPWTGPGRKPKGHNEECIERARTGEGATAGLLQTIHYTAMLRGYSRWADTSDGRVNVQPEHPRLVPGAPRRPGRPKEPAWTEGKVNR